MSEGLSDVDRDIEILRRTGRFGSEEEFLEAALRALLEKNPKLRIDLAVGKYESGDVSLNRAAEIAGLSPEEFKETLDDRGTSRSPGFLSEDERQERLEGL